MSVKRNLRIAIVIADCTDEPFKSIKELIHPAIYRPFKESGINIFYAFGKPSTKLVKFYYWLNELMRYTKFGIVQRAVDRVLLRSYNSSLPIVINNNSNLRVDVNEGLRYLGVKMLATFNHLYEEGYDLIYKTTMSSIVSFEHFSRIAHEINMSEPYYGGTLISFPRTNFVSGANLLLNRNALQILLRNSKYWDHGKLDDVAIGDIMHDMNVDIYPLLSFHFNGLSELVNVEPSVLRSAFHIRCKSNAFPRQDVQIMREVISKIEIGN